MLTCRRKPRMGFTLVELLVVIAIIGILIALLLPAVQAAREAARRSSCTNNLKQLGLALHMHHDRDKTFPPGHYSPPQGTSCSNGSEATWWTYILPFLEQSSAYDSINWDHGFGCGGNSVVRGHLFETAQCPSDRRSEGSQSAIGWSGDWVRSNYVANNGIGPMAEWCVVRQDVSQLPPRSREGGLFYINSDLPIAEMHDGTSQTAMVSEIRVSYPGDFRGVMHYPEAPLYHHNYTPNSLVPDQIRTPHCEAGDQRLVPCQGAFAAWNQRQMIQTARSFHPGGVNLAMGDGSVHFISETIGINVWQALCTPKRVEGEVIVSDF